MEKKKIAISAIIITVVIIAAGTILFLQNKKMEERSNDTNSNVEIVKSGERITIDSAVGGFSSSWTGTMELVLNDVSLYNDYTDAGIESEDMASEKWDDDKFILCDITIKNINAKSISEDDCYNFYISMIRIGDGRGIDYFDEAKIGDDRNKKYYYVFNLREGEEKKYKIGYWIPEEILKDKNLALKIGNTSEDAKYGIEMHLE